MVDVRGSSPAAVAERPSEPGDRRLLIAIPALDEEASIASIIERCLAAAPAIIAATEVTSVSVTVVSDGSTDQTVEIASRYLDRIDLIVFEKNRGYGAAIKEAWRRSDAELLAFLDADGTCDPNFFVPLCRAVLDDGADIALGCRLNEESEMPRLRRVGNRIFAVLLSALSSSQVRDTASGMRVVRSDALPQLYPLPNGLHFTPAMSARVMLSNELRLVEIDMPYHEREGESKLRAGKDGIRFLRVILKTAVLFRPSRLLGMTAIPFLAFGVLLLVLPAADWLGDGVWPSGLRGVQAAAGVVLLTAAALLFCAGYLAGRIVEVVLGVQTGGRSYRLLREVIGAKWFWAIPFALSAAAIVAGLLGWLSDIEGRGLFSMVVLGAAAVLAGVTRLLDRFVDVVADRLRFERTAATSRGAGR
jgi:hypothetical protein